MICPRRFVELKDRDRAAPCRRDLFQLVYSYEKNEAVQAPPPKHGSASVSSCVERDMDSFFSWFERYLSCSSVTGIDRLKIDR